METLHLREHLTDQWCEDNLKGKYLSETSFDQVVQTDTDAYSLNGELLFKFRKNRIPYDILHTGYMAFKDSIYLTEGRGMASGGSFKRKRKDGSRANTTVSNFVESGAVGYMDPNAMIHYCRKTAFTSAYFEKFQTGVPFVQCVDRLYKELCEEYWNRQMNIARGTNRNYVIAHTSFTTVTVNRNFQTSVHKDSGDFQRGFGNLCIYREGTEWSGSYFVLPQYRIAIDMQNCDILFVDVHRWHGNSPFINFSPAPTPFSTSARNPARDKYKWDGVDLRIAFVMYYREYMINCKSPSQELHDVKQEQGGFLKL